MKQATTNDHDSLVYRLAQILIKLNQGEKLDPQALAEEFGVNRRTIQRDLNERFVYLPLEKMNGRYHLHQAFLGKINAQDIEHFASLAGVRGLFPSLSVDFLREVFDSRIQSARLVKGVDYEDLRGKEHRFRQLEQAILARQKVTYAYRKSDGLKTYAGIEPYKLVNHGGIWYLAGKDDGQLKAFSFSLIEQLCVSDVTFEFDATVDKTLRKEEGIWLNDKKTKVVLTIAKDVAGYFKRSKLVPHQVIEKEQTDGGLLVSAEVAHMNQILPTVRQWIPHIRIVSPEGLQAEMEQEIQGYLGVS